MLNRHFGLSPSGKAKDFDSFTRRFESGQPRHAAGAKAPAVFFARYLFSFAQAALIILLSGNCFEMR